MRTVLESLADDFPAALAPVRGGVSTADAHMTDREMVQLVCAFRLMFPDVGLCCLLGIASLARWFACPWASPCMSAGSHTEPGGYTGRRPQ
jgi:2-iminoacetate synthase